MEIQGPDGAIIEFPDGTSHDIIKGAMAKRYGAPKPSPPAMQDLSAEGGQFGQGMEPQPSQMPYGEQMSKALGSMGMLADGAVRGAANGATFGMADRLAAVMSDKPYSEALRDERQKTADAPLSGVGEVAGMLGTGVGLARSGVTLAGRVGSGLLPRSLGYGAEGATYGALTEAGKNDGSLADKAASAKHGAIVGGSIGLGLPIVGSAIGKGYEVARTILSRPVPGVTRGANVLTRMAVGEPDLARLKELGPDAMLADASPSLLGLAQGAAAKPGAAKDQIVNSLALRDAGTSPRLQAAREASLGPRVVPSQVEADLAAGRSALSPEYQSVLGQAKAVDTSPLAAKLEEIAINSRGPAQSAARDVRSMLDIPGNPGKLDPFPASLLESRRAVDGLRGATMDNNTKRVLGNARAAIDEELAAKVPGLKAVDAKFAELSGQSRGLERGQEVFDTARSGFIRPEELAGDMRAAAAPKGVVPGPSAEPFRMRQGMNADVDRRFATGADDLRAMETDFRRPANAEKLAIGVGDEKASALLDAITQNRRFRDTYNAVDRGSQTAQRQVANAQIEGTNAALPNSVSELPMKAVNKILSVISGRASDATRKSIADLVTMKGPEAQSLIEAILAAQTRAKSGAEFIQNTIANPGVVNLRAGASLPDKRENRRTRQ